MIDINFYMKIFELKKELMTGKTMDRKYLFEKFEQCRSRYPVVYNIETTNACNMRCEMCPRTTMMTRSIQTLDMDIYRRIIEQISPFSDTLWQEWEEIVENRYGISRHGMNENWFFLYVIPKLLVLHGYGDPLLDTNIAERIKLLTERNIPSYFSCNPANINIDKVLEIFENGLDYIKFSIESTDDNRHKNVRGNASDFTNSYKSILRLLELKKKYAYKTTIVITMLNLNKPWQQEEFSQLKLTFKDKDVYIYLKSQDQQWYEDNRQQSKSIHWAEFCQFPWSSMTIKSNGEAVSCVEDFNNEIILGDANRESLLDIWNSRRYKKFREDHFDLTPGIKCTEQCDMKLIGSFVNKA
jgi:radical SAM protein with 4Fe4S-binding SPASM domain